MKKIRIFLASDSKARKKLLDIFGLKFKVIPSRAEEEKPSGKVSYAGLVKRNALKKAINVSSRVKNGVIIAADTIVVQDNKTYGKPRGLKDARNMLKKISSKPQWLYTGLAVIDKGAGKHMVDYEKTKVYMDKLTDKEINRYFAHTSPMGKAGSFDIQGRGAFFIRRIEGCFYNVVGLPLRKLYRMLKEMKVLPCVLFLVSCALITGCQTEYNLVTKAEETYFYSTDKEVKMGQSIDRQIAQHYKEVDDPLMDHKVREIGKKIAAVCDRKDIDYHFRVIDEDDVNAVSLPGGYVYIFKGLVEKAASDDELAGVIAHEVGHIVARHSIKKLQAQQGFMMLRMLLAAAPSSTTAQAGNAADLAFTEIMLGYSREDELLADQLAARYSKLAGYDPKGTIRFLERLQDIHRKSPPRPYSYYKTHPYIPDRIRVVKEELGQRMSFDDYINIQQKTHEQN